MNNNFDLVIFELDETKGLINLTEMCKPFGKKVAHFMELTSTKNFITSLSKRKELSEITIVKEGVNGGTWGCKELAIKCASWLDSEFEVYCMIKLDELFSTGSTTIKPLSFTEMLVQQAIALDKFTKEQERLALEQREIKNDLIELKSNINPDYTNNQTTVIGFVNVLLNEGNLERALEEKEYSILGREASKISRERRIPIGTVPCRIHGTKNVYSKDILREIFDKRGLIK